MWTSIGNETHCSVHGTHTPRGIPCPQCVADPNVPLSDRDVARIADGQSTTYYEDKLNVIGETCMRLAGELIDGSRPVVCERTEPVMLAAKLMELAARTFGRGGEFATKREARLELETLRRAVRDMRAAH